MLQQLKDKFPSRTIDIRQETYSSYQPEEELQLKADKILSKLDWHATPCPSGLRDGHLRLWTGAFAPPSGDTAVENLEKLISDMVTDNLPAWFIRMMQGADLLAIAKTEKQ